MSTASASAGIVAARARRTCPGRLVVRLIIGRSPYVATRRRATRRWSRVRAVRMGEGAVRCGPVRSRGRRAAARVATAPPGRAATGSADPEAGDELREGRVRPVAIREDGAPVRRPRHGRPGNRRERVVPGEAQLVGPVELVRDEVDELEGLEGEEAVGNAGGDRDRGVAREPREPRRWDDPRCPPRAAATSTSATSARPSVTIQWSSWRRWRCRPRRTPGDDVERFACVKAGSGRPARRGSSAPNALARQSSRKLPRRSP